MSTDPILILLAGTVAAVGGVTGPLLLRRAQAKEKTVDRQREDDVAIEARRQQDQVAAAAERAAELLRVEQAKTTKSAQEAAAGTKEVARLVAEGDASTSKLAVQEATPIVLFYPDGERQEVVLAGVPRKGEMIRLRNGRNAPRLLVEAVLWMEAFLPPPNPSVIIVVRPERPNDAKPDTT